MQEFISIKGPVALLFGLVLIVFLSCQRKSHFFFVRNQGAVMPVKVSGNIDAGSFLILLPGGSHLHANAVDQWSLGYQCSVFCCAGNV